MCEVGYSGLGNFISVFKECMGVMFKVWWEGVFGDWVGVLDDVCCFS